MKLANAVFIVLALSVAAPSFADQPNMQAALTSLQQARDSLEHAVADKGGHRTNAIKRVDQAIAEVKAGIEYARTHPN
jgi:hypothetical protein